MSGGRTDSTDIFNNIINSMTFQIVPGLLYEIFVTVQTATKREVFLRCFNEKMQWKGVYGDNFPVRAGREDRE